MGERRGEYRVLVGKLEGKRPFGRPRHKWKDNIKMDLQEVGWGGIGWIDLAQDRDRCRVLMNMVLKELYDPAEACSMNGERRGACRDLVGKHAGKSPLGRPRLRWEYNVKVNL